MILEKSFGRSITTNMNPTILVYGWYHQGNLGDDLFVDAFKYIFPSFNFVFTDQIQGSHLQGVDAVFFGGGSFLGEPLKVSYDAFEALKKLPLMYIGVGGETAVHSSHQELLPLAKLIALRSYARYDDLKRINQNIIVIPDLVYSLQGRLSIQKTPNSVLFIPNISVIPKWDSPHWKHAAWDYFKIEMAQLLDNLITDKYPVSILPFCINDQLNDHYAAAEIMNRMNEIGEVSILEKPSGIKSVIETISAYRVVITQRFHGTVLSEMSGTPCLTIHHHDKLKGITGTRVSYYSCSKNLLREELNNILLGKVSPVLPIDRNIFTSLRQKVEHALCRSEK